ncbi:MAG TPA: DUF535 family protein [Candidatus Angelobacter sp.]|nr:DUF535 family protein [Candidatus Angelobacter sp.]
MLRKTLFSMLASTAPLVHRRAPATGGLLKRAKYVARGLAFARYTREWFDFLHQPAMASIIRRHPHLYHKLQRPYLNCTLNTQQRLEALKQHYHFVFANFPPEIREHLYEPAGLSLASLALKDLGEFQLRLTCSGKQKEGDFAVGLLKAGGQRDLFTLSFSVWKYHPAEKEIFIGGLQGSRAASREVVVDLTRALYGLRPKALLLFVVQELAAYWNIPQMRAVSDAAHIYQHFQKRKTFSATYDEFWLECGGKVAADGMFDLPAAFVPREISTIKVNKRQMYRRRYDMLASLRDQIRAQLGDSSLPADEPAPRNRNQ